MRVEHKPKGTEGQAVKPVLPPCLQPLRLPPGSASAYKADAWVFALFLRTLHVDLHLMFFIRHVSKMIFIFQKVLPPAS